MPLFVTNQKKIKISNFFGKVKIEKRSKDNSSLINIGNMKGQSYFRSGSHTITCKCAHCDRIMIGANERIVKTKMDLHLRISHNTEPLYMNTKLQFNDRQDYANLNNKMIKRTSN